MASVRAADLLLVSFVVFYTSGTLAVDIDLASLLRGRQRQAVMNHKRSDQSGNPCPEPEKPFPCKTTPTCVPMVYVCDDNYDCEDGYDEDVEVCTAAHRPPVEDIMHFLDSEKDWLMPNLFEGKSVGKIAHGLAISQTVDDFKRRVGLSSKAVKTLKEALNFVRRGDEEGMQELGMPPSAWNECVFFFDKLIKSGFDN